MAYQAARRMKLAGVEVLPGDLIDEALLAEFPIGRLDSLRRVGHIIEVPSGAVGRSRRRGRAAEEAPAPPASVASPVETVDEEPDEAPEEVPAEEDDEVVSEPEAST